MRSRFSNDRMIRADPSPRTECPQSLPEDSVARGPACHRRRYLDLVRLPASLPTLREENVEHIHPADAGLLPGDLPRRAEAAVQQQGAERDPAVPGEAVGR